MNCFYCKKPMKKCVGEYPARWGDTILVTVAEWWECDCNGDAKMFTPAEVRRLQFVAQKIAGCGSDGV